MKQRPLPCNPLVLMMVPLLTFGCGSSNGGGSNNAGQDAGSNPGSGNAGSNSGGSSSGNAGSDGDSGISSGNAGSDGDGGTGGDPSSGGDGGPCGDTSSVAAFFESNAGTFPATVADSGGGIATQFTGTYNLLIGGPDGMYEGSVIVDQLTPQRSVPYSGYIFSYMDPPDSYQDAANEVNVVFDGHIGLHVLIQCDKATGVISFGATNRMDGMSFVRLEIAP